MFCFCVNLFMLFIEVDFFECFDVVVKVGFIGVEYFFFYDVEVEVIKVCLEVNSLEQVLFNLLVGDWVKGECGIVCCLDWVQEFCEGVDKVIVYVRVLGNCQVNCFVGIWLQGYDCVSVEKIFVDNLCYVVDKLEVVGICLVMEMINIFDIFGFYLQNICQVLEICDKVGSVNLFL